MAEAQESSSPRCLLLLAGGLPSSVSGTILLAGACKPLAYRTRLWLGRAGPVFRLDRVCASYWCTVCVYVIFLGFGL